MSLRQTSTLAALAILSALTMGRQASTADSSRALQLNQSILTQHRLSSADRDWLMREALGNSSASQIAVIALTAADGFHLVSHRDVVEMLKKNAIKGTPAQSLSALLELKMDLQIGRTRGGAATGQLRALNEPAKPTSGLDHTEIAFLTFALTQRTMTERSLIGDAVIGKRNLDKAAIHSIIAIVAPISARAAGQEREYWQFVMDVVHARSPAPR